MVFIEPLMTGILSISYTDFAYSDPPTSSQTHSRIVAIQTDRPDRTSVTTPIPGTAALAGRGVQHAKTVGHFQNVVASPFATATEQKSIMSTSAMDDSTLRG